MKTTLNKFAVALGAFENEMLMTINDKWNRVLAKVKLDMYMKGIYANVESMAKNGEIDIDDIHKYVNSLFLTCDDEIPVRLDFVVNGFKIAEPVTIVIKKSDSDKFFNETIASISEIQ